MRKITHLICLLLLLSLLLTGCNGAVNQPTEPDETPAETPAETLPYEEDGVFVTTSDAMDYEIQCALFKKWSYYQTQTPNEICIPYFYGEFNGIYALGFELGGTCAVEGQCIGEYEFIYSSGGIKHDVYNSKDGEFYTLKEAYDKGFLTIEDIGVIHEKFVKVHAHSYDNEHNKPSTSTSTSNNQPPVIEIIDGYYYINGVNTWVKAGSATN